MPSYDICYLKDDGTLAGKLSAQCQNEKQAKILAHAMRLKGSRRIEVWDGKALIYQRPDRAFYELAN